MKQKTPMRFKEKDLVQSLESDLVGDEGDSSISNNSNLMLMDSKENTSSFHGENKRSPMRWIAISTGFLIFTLSVSQLIDAILSIMDYSIVGGVLVALLNSFGLILVIRALFHLLRNRNDLRRQELLKNELNQLRGGQSIDASISKIENIHELRKFPSAVSLELFKEQSLVCQNDQEVIELYETNVLTQLDLEAKKAIVRHSTETSLMIALSPFALVDMVLVLWRNLKLVDEISLIYGLKHIPFSRFKILRQVFKNMMLFGASELIMDYGVDNLVKSFSAKVSARIAQGLGAGLATARIGIHAMEYCRPLSYKVGERPKISDMRALILPSVKERLMKKVD